jgi:glycerol-3-phosphate acyltransferase PlsY
MNDILIGILAILIAYLLGSVPSAYIMGRLRKGVDIRNLDSGNMGAANVVRQIGIWEGIVVGFVDVAKGAAAIIIAMILGVSQFWVFGAGFSALMGHNFPVYLGFRGGKGSATIVGIFLVLEPLSMLVILVIMAIPLFTTRKFAFAIAIGFALLPLFIWIFEGSWTLIFYSLFIDIFMVIRTLPFITRSWQSKKEIFH